MCFASRPLQYIYEKHHFSNSSPLTPSAASRTGVGTKRARPRPSLGLPSRTEPNRRTAAAAARTAKRIRYKLSQIPKGFGYFASRVAAAFRLRITLHPQIHCSAASYSIICPYPSSFANHVHTHALPFTRDILCGRTRTA